MNKILIFITIAIMLSAANVYAERYNFAISDLPYYPYFEETTDGEVKGFIPEMVRKFSQDMGLDIKIKFRPVKRYYLELVQGKTDFIIPDTENWSSEVKKGHDVFYSSPFLISIDGLLVKTEQKDAKIASIKRVGTPMGFTPWAIIDKVNSGEISLSYNPSQRGLLLQILEDRIDAAYICVSVGMYYAKHELERDERFMFAQNMPYSRDKWRLSTIKHPAMIKKFDQWLKENADWVTKKKKEMAVELGENMIRLQESSNNEK